MFIWSVSFWTFALMELNCVFWTKWCTRAILLQYFFTRWISFWNEIWKMCSIFNGNLTFVTCKFRVIVFKEIEIRKTSHQLEFVLLFWNKCLHESYLTIHWNWEYKYNLNSNMSFRLQIIQLFSFCCDDDEWNKMMSIDLNLNACESFSYELSNQYIML